MSQQTHKSRRPSSLPTASQRALLRHAQYAINYALRGGTDAGIRTRPSTLNLPLDDLNNADCYRPRMDLFDDPLTSKTVAVFEVPGVRKEDLRLRVEDDVLLLVGRRRPRYRTNLPTSPGEPVVDGAPVAFYAQDITYGVFRRRIALPAGCQPEDIDVELADGHLTLQWPRVVASQGKPTPAEPAPPEADSAVCATSPASNEAIIATG
ncbi:hypothetical protein HDZ31DRAFT_62621 [Schizophyllum fasciatum]